jgi:hypothetical protein
VDRPFSERAKLAGLVALLVLQVACFAYYLSHSRYLPGTDAYYYALQTQSLLDSGHLKVPDVAVLYCLIAAVCRVGVSIEAAFRIALAGIFSIYNLGCLLLIVRLKDKTQSAAILLWVLGSSAIAFHTVEFPKLSLGLSLVPIWFLLAAGTRKGRAFWLVVLLATCALLHPMLIFLVLLFVLTLLIGRGRLADAWIRRFSISSRIGVLVGCALMLVASTTLWPGLRLRFASLRPGTPGVVSLATSGDIPRDLIATISVIWLLLLLFFIDHLLSGSSRWKYLIAATLVIPFWPDRDSGFFGLGGRLAVAFVFLAVPLIIVMGDERDDQGRLFTWLQSSRARGCLALVAIAIACALPIRLNGYNGLLVGEDYASYERVVAALSHDDIRMLIAHRGLDFLYSYRLRRDAFHFDPEPNWNRAEIWRVAMRITPEEAAYYSSAPCLWGETARTIPHTDYLLVREDCWERLRSRLTRTDNPDLYIEVWKNPENPSQQRPGFLRSKHHNVIEKSFPAFSGDGN